MSGRNGLSGKKTIHPPSVNRPKNRRRISALNLLEKQLISGVKTIKGSFTEVTSLLPEDVTRIKKQIEILKKKIIS